MVMVANVLPYFFLIQSVKTITWSGVHHTFADEIFLKNGEFVITENISNHATPPPEK